MPVVEKHRRPKSPKKEDVLKSLRLANDYFMEKWSDPGEAIPYPSRKRNYETNVWTRAYYYEGLIDLWEIDPQQRYLDYALEWGNKHDWKLRGTKNGWKTVMPTINVPVRLISIFISSTPRNPSGISPTSKPLSTR